MLYTPVAVAVLAVVVKVLYNPKADEIPVLEKLFSTPLALPENPNVKKLYIPVFVPPPPPANVLKIALVPELELDPPI